MPDPTAAVDRQVEAYNARDIEAFAACYADDVVIVDASAGERTRGRAQLIEQYGRWFERHPGLHVDVVSRIAIGAYVVDEERVTGVPGADIHAVAIYRIGETGLIEHVQFLP